MPITLLTYLAVGLAAVALYLALKSRRERAAAQRQAEAVRAGLTEPPSLHPVVDPHRCIGSGGCTRACPEGALGVVGGKAVLVNASACIGHGACRAACPVEAIQLVFGTERRGVDIPTVTPQFESNVPGLFIAGELGGMGLIAKAAGQGRQAMGAIRRRKADTAELDVLIVGAGPAGLSAGLGALEHRLRYRLIEQEPALGGTVYHYPRQKIAMTTPVELALAGRMRLGEVAKESLLDYWQGVVGRTGLQVHFNETLLDIARDGDGFVVTTSEGRHRARSVLLAIGRRGSPRKLGVPGEESAKVVYRLNDPAQYRGQAVLVVGGGDSALEAAIALADEPGTRVTLSYRSDAFSRVKAANRERLQARQAEGRVQVLMASTVQAIAPHTVSLATADGPQTLPNDAVIVCAGGVLPTALLQRLGIEFTTKYGTA